ncbi:uncharacterized protein LOC108241475 [Kryptolebias marmoratus]|uniref:uncharacterized protein LOC108241475 n=1 Tax=Kryptolebias marmoratus TaxID=37003 RepID=UPI0007F8B796|nr:uncharacterized protein LOC108241475 [Kryptolebias marmoratus]
MGQQDNQADVESLQKSEHRRGSCVNIFLFMSIFVLFLSVTALAVCGVMVVRELRSEVRKSFRLSEFGTVEKLQGTQGPPTFKMQNFAYVEATSCEVKDGMMKWSPVTYGERSSIGSNFAFDDVQQSLSPRQMGTYFIYIEVNLTCTSTCSAGEIKLKVGSKLTCDVELPAHERSVTKKCWTVSQLDTEGLVTRMVTSGNLENWKLEMTGSGLGMFLID